MNNPILSLSKKEWALWVGSLFVVAVSNIISGDFDLLTLFAALVGVTSLILASRENPIYIPVVVDFFIFFLNDMYGFVSWKKREKKQNLAMR